MLRSFIKTLYFNGNAAAGSPLFNEEVPVWRQVPLGQKLSCCTLLEVFQSSNIFEVQYVSGEVQKTKTNLICSRSTN